MTELKDKKKVVIIGAGGHAHVIADIIVATGDEVIAFLDDDINAPDRKGNIKDYVKYEDAEFVIGIGNADVRERIASTLNVRWYKAIHPSAIISPSAKIGDGTVVMPNVVINARTVVGNHCIINTGAIVEHDNRIDDLAHISVGAKLGGTVSVGRKTWVGIGATIKNNVSICDNCIVGAGSTVVNHIMEAGTYVGLPSRKIK